MLAEIDFFFPHLFKLSVHVRFNNVMVVYFVKHYCNPQLTFFWLPFIAANIINASSKVYRLTTHLNKVDIFT